MSEKLSFQDLGLSASTLAVMLKQESNIIAQAQTGTGKTAAFGLPLLDLIDTRGHYVQALILAPTRELAVQVSEEIHSLKGNKDLQVVPIYGGQSMDIQFRRLRKGANIVVGTPGRVIDHLNRGTLKLDKLAHLILDEADEMLNMGFLEDMEEIMKHTPEEKRTLLFSATMPKRIKDLAHKYMGEYELLAIEKETLTTNLTEQIYYEVKHSDKFEALCRIVDLEESFYGLVFCRTKMDVDNTASHLMERGYDAEAIHGDISQSQRERTLGKFRKQKINILVATDVAARGIDINNLTHVINYSLPQDPESYVHRIGRTGRAGNHGTAITFITPAEYRRLMFIQKVAKADIKKAKVPQVKDIIKAKRKKIFQDLEKIMETGMDDRFHKWAEKLQEEHNAPDVLAALLKYSFDDDVNPDNYGEIQDVSYSPKKQMDSHGKSRLFVALGKKDGLNARGLVDVICDRVSINPRKIDDVQVMENFSFITVPFEQAEEIVKSFMEKGKKPLITHAKAKESGGKGSYNRDRGYNQDRGYNKKPRGSYKRKK
jgi:ATP-dependent RNA helicase DeaD